MKLLILLLTFIPLFANSAKSIDATTLEKYISKRAIIIDIRTKTEQNQEGTIPSSYTITYKNSSDLEMKRWKFKLLKVIKSPNQSFALIDKDGKKSKNLANKLKKAGFKKVFYLEGGFNAWVKEEKRVIN
ncbi:rhodanese-like domain-containing protein [Malaciobacter marinus]|uniref:Rhodanese-like domain-containing protein n=1 Tax=Malaciobacter marinus TaxID=505249 RepID=A0A347TNY9_9BACT|nr:MULTISPECIES: rhodanese-like domain-containing protein [Malaciobacter]AXX88317.1 rhodanese-like domain-containing protein [Malaciobacter marinus]PHO13352.1 hypothetical protein CPG38_02560 [Malaciobacter marinus]PHO15666.1 hypothetical protein CPH92_05785 [Malaciobacter marinus]RYA24571.1 rhodanese-like domain-containing protein [Malaciobacter halophilus]